MNYFFINVQLLHLLLLYVHFLMIQMVVKILIIHPQYLLQLSYLEQRIRQLNQNI